MSRAELAQHFVCVLAEFRSRTSLLRRGLRHFQRIAKAAHRPRMWIVPLDDHAVDPGLFRALDVRVRTDRASDDIASRRVSASTRPSCVSRTSRKGW